MNTSSQNSDMVSISVSDIREFNEKVDKYYQYKSIYEKAIQDKKRKIKKNAVASRLSDRETMSAFQKYKPLCISCMRAVGSVFEKKKKDGVYHLLARCGDSAEPCQLDIDLQMGDIFDLLKEKRAEEMSMNAYIQEIIIIKNDELFGFITEDQALNKFLKINKDLDTVIDNYRSLLSAYIEVRNNTKNAVRINELSSQLVNLIGNIKKNMIDYESSGNRQFVRETAEIYARDIIKLVDEINSLKYKSMRMEYDAESGVHKLYQKFTLVDSFQLAGNMKTIRFLMGKEVQSKNTVTRKADTSFVESEAQFSEGPLTDNITNMSMRDAVDISDDEDTNDLESPVRLTHVNLASMQPSKSADITMGAAADIENNSVSESESDGRSIISDDSSMMSDKPAIKIGELLDDSSSDSYVPPPPPEMEGLSDDEP